MQIKQRRSKINTEQIIQDFKNVHGETYDYSMVSYKTMHTKVVIICSQHGQFEQTPNAHIRQKQGCPICSKVRVPKLQTDNTESFISKAKKVHGDRYLYSNTTYGKNAHEKVIIDCRIHGPFKISPNSFLSKAAGCKKCGNIAAKRKLIRNNGLGWSKTKYIERSKGLECTLYIIRCYNNQESFYKIGITNKTIEARYGNRHKMPYDYDLIYELKSKDSGFIYDEEHKILRETSNLKYKPQIYFAGSRLECRKDIPARYKVFYYDTRKSKQNQSKSPKRSS